MRFEIFSLLALASLAASQHGIGHGKSLGIGGGSGFGLSSGIGLGGKGIGIAGLGLGGGKSLGVSHGAGLAGHGGGFSGLGLGSGLGKGFVGGLSGKTVETRVVSSGFGAKGHGLGGVSAVHELSGIHGGGLGASYSAGLGSGVEVASGLGSKGLIPTGYGSGFGGGLGAEFHGVDLHAGAVGGDVHGLGGVAAIEGLGGLTHGKCPHGLERTLYGKCVEPLVSKDLFLYKAPDYQIHHKKAYYDHKPKVHYNLLFIRAPGYKDHPLKPIVVPPPKQKTLVYLLSKKPHGYKQNVIEVPATPTKPEVFFVNYKDGDNPTLPGGIDLQTALSQSAGIGGSIGHGISGGVGHGIASSLDYEDDVHGEVLVDAGGFKGGLGGAGLGFGSSGFKGDIGVSTVVEGSSGFKGGIGGGLGLKGGLGAGIGLQGGFDDSVALKGGASSGGLKHEFVDSIKGGVDQDFDFEGSLGGGFKGAGGGSVAASYGSSLGSGHGGLGLGHGGGFSSSKRVVINAKGY